MKKTVLVLLSQQIKKKKSDSSNEVSLETRNIVGEENKSELMPIDMDNQSADTQTQSKQKNIELKEQACEK